jgi:uncharacterized phage protein (TIGR02216 family)
MEAGLGPLRLSPVAFWAMTLPEFAAALRGAGIGAGLAPVLPREAFDHLMQLYPDRQDVTRQATTGEEYHDE